MLTERSSRTHEKSEVWGLFYRTDGWEGSFQEGTDFLQRGMWDRTKPAVSSDSELKRTQMKGESGV